MMEKRTPVKELLQSAAFGTQVHVKGWVQTQRGNKSVVFIALNDGSTIHHLQIVADPNHFNEEIIKQANTGACIAVTGNLIESQGQGQTVEVQATHIEIYGTADLTKYPLQAKRHSLEFLREIAHLRPRTRTFGASTLR